jgi:hypothetical protein
MGSTRDFISATLADSLLPLLRRPVEDVIYETLDNRQIPSRTDFSDLRDVVDALRGQVSGATQGIKRLMENTGQESPDITGLDTRLLAIEARLTAMEERIAQGSAAPTLTAVPDAKSCQVADCASKPKARGLCTRHYNRWRRGSLEGFPKTA